MQKLDIIFKTLTLIYRESYLENRDNNSCVLIENIMDTIKTNGKFVMLGEKADMVENLKKFVLDTCEANEEKIDKDILLQSLLLIVNKDQSLVDIFERTIIKDLNDEDLKKQILTLRRFLNNYYKDHEINNILSSASYRFKNERATINSSKDFVNGVLEKLDVVNGNNGAVDPAIINEVDINNTASIDSVLEEVKENSIDAGKLLTGWQGMNIMTNNGFRRGESIMLGSLQHKYKSGMTNSLFMQIAMNNEPKMIDDKKKPLLLLISMEDDMPITIDFMFRYLYYNEHKKLPNFKNIDIKEASDYIKKKLSVKGYNVNMIRVDPTLWSYKGLFNLLDKYESDGFEIHGLFLDYLAMIPTVGCNVSGPMGTDMRDLVRRIRNRCAKSYTTLFTPHQLSVDAKLLIRNGVPDATFVKELVGKGYFSGSRQLDQEYDLIFYGHIAKINGTACLTVARDKHRSPVILDDKYKYWYMPFPKGAPIPEDINDEKSLAVFPDASNAADDVSGGFSF